MSRIVLDIPTETLESMRMSAEQFGAELRIAGAAKLFELGRLSSGAAAEVAGLPRTVFLIRLADYGVETFRLTEEELGREARLG